MSRICARKKSAASGRQHRYQHPGDFPPPRRQRVQPKEISALFPSLVAIIGRHKHWKVDLTNGHKTISFCNADRATAWVATMCVELVSCDGLAKKNQQTRQKTGTIISTHFATPKRRNGWKSPSDLNGHKEVVIFALQFLLYKMRIIWRNLLFCDPISSMVSLVRPTMHA